MEFKGVWLLNVRVFTCFGALFCVVLRCEELAEECNDWVRFSINRTSLKHGFHRDILTTVHWSLGNNHLALPDTKCGILFVEHIPQELFIDLDELRSQNFSKVIPLTKTNIDVEQPAHLSIEHKVLVYAKYNLTRHLEDRKLEISSTNMLPVHWRYQKPTQNKHYVDASLSVPMVLGKCEGFIPDSLQRCLSQLQTVQYPCDPNSKQICQWFTLKQHSANSKMVINFTIPAGLYDHMIIVTSGTITIAISAAFFLIWL